MLNEIMNFISQPIHINSILLAVVGSYLCYIITFGVLVGLVIVAETIQEKIRKRKQRKQRKQ